VQTNVIQEMEKESVKKNGANGEKLNTLPFI